MSTRTGSILECNGARCHRRIVAQPGQDVLGLHDQAESMGWAYSPTPEDDIDYCPLCRASYNRRVGT